eukprot:Pgem_evm1s8897
MLNTSSTNNDNTMIPILMQRCNNLLPYNNGFIDQMNVGTSTSGPPDVQGPQQLCQVQRRGSGISRQGVILEQHNQLQNELEQQETVNTMVNEQQRYQSSIGKPLNSATLIASSSNSPVKQKQNPHQHQPRGIANLKNKQTPFYPN